MRSALVVLLGLAGIALFVLRTERRAGALLEAEAAAAGALPGLAAAGTGPEAHAHGYAFAWHTGGAHPPMLVARPLEPGRTGARWFATRDGSEILEYDPTVFQLPRDGAPVEALRGYLALPQAERRDVPRPFGWKPLH